MQAVHIHQIHYSPQQQLDPGFTALDNTANQRPDWFEYWPMRNFLLHEILDDNAYTLKIQFSPDAEGWSDVLTGVYRRIN